MKLKKKAMAKKLKGINKWFTREKTQKTNNPIKQCSNSLGIWEIQIKVTTKCYFLFTELAKILIDSIQWWSEYGKQALSHTVGGNITATTFRNTVSSKYLSRFSMNVSFEPAIWIVRIYPQKYSQLHKNFTSALLIIGKNCKYPQKSHQ